jgi:hypothetical protein
MNAAARQWIASHLRWIVVAALALWTPPVVASVAVYRGWRDPAVLLTIVELVLMGGALRGLAARRLAAWWLLLLSRGAVLAQTAWLLLVNARLDGLLFTLQTKPMIEATLGLAISFLVLGTIRGQYR